MYKQLDIYDELFDHFYNYTKALSPNNVTISKKSPPTITKFPTIILKEVQNLNTNNISLNRQEFTDLLSFQVDIYTKDIVENGVEYASLQIQKELKNITFDFFLKNGFTRTAFENWENNNIVYDRLTMIFQCNLNSWNKKIK